MFKRKKVSIIGSSKFEKEIKILEKKLKKSGIKVETRENDRFKKFSYQKWIKEIKTSDFVILYNKNGYIGSRAYHELEIALKFCEHVFSISNKYFGFKIGSDHTINFNNYILNDKVKLPKLYIIFHSELYKNRVLIITTKIKKKYYETYWRNRNIIDTNLMIEDIEKEENIYPIPLSVDIIIIDNIETYGFISKIAYEYIYSYIISKSVQKQTTKCYLSVLPKWDMCMLDIDQPTTLRDSFIIKPRHRIKEFGNQEFFKLERR